MRLALIAAVVLAAPAAQAGNGFGIIVPPAEVDLGVLAPADGSQLAAPGTEVLAGVHWASLYWKPSRIDFGVGYVGSFRPLAFDSPYAARTTRPLERELDLNGMYIELGRTFIRDPHVRSWISARGELMRSSGLAKDVSVSGAALRVSTELYKSGWAADGKNKSVGVIAGTFALGVYVEASYRDLPSALGAGGIATGFTLRVPFILLAVD